MTDDRPEPHITLDDIDAHAASMVEQPWWPLFAYEQAAPACPDCGGPQIAVVGGGWVCADEV